MRDVWSFRDAAGRPAWELSFAFEEGPVQRLVSSTVTRRVKTVAVILPAVDFTLLVLNIAGAFRLLTLALMGNGRGLGVRAVVRLAVVGIFRLSGGSSRKGVTVELPSNTEQARQQHYPPDRKCSPRDDEVATL
jgi:hypothetical protein